MVLRYGTGFTYGPEKAKPYNILNEANSQWGLLAEEITWIFTWVWAGRVESDHATPFLQTWRFLFLIAHAMILQVSNSSNPAISFPVQIRAGKPYLQVSTVVSSLTWISGLFKCFCPLTTSYKLIQKSQCLLDTFFFIEAKVLGAWAGNWLNNLASGYLR